MRVLVTGAAGFVGWHVMNAFKTAGVNAIGLDQQRADGSIRWDGCTSDPLCPVRLTGRLPVANVVISWPVIVATWPSTPISRIVGP